MNLSLPAERAGDTQSVSRALHRRACALEGREGLLGTSEGALDKASPEQASRTAMNVAELVEDRLGFCVSGARLIEQPRRAQ
jgi:hypothetical protein